jgi:glutamate-5-semialdehyde dehydrogenase
LRKIGPKWAEEHWKKMSDLLLKRLRLTRFAARALRQAPSGQKNQVLLKAAALLKEREDRILKANRKDLLAVEKLGKAKRGSREVTPAFIDRLTLNSQRLQQMGDSLRQVAELPDPIGEVVEARTLANGLYAKRVRSPLGVIFMIFESRPNVAMEAFSLGFKSGNAMILRGGKESAATVRVLYSILSDSLQSQGLSRESLWGIENPDRKIPAFLLQQKDWIDVVVPRGGEGLIDFVTRSSRIPVIKNDRGLCHVYVHEDADLEMAARIVVNAKSQRPGVCNAMETLLVHSSVAARFLPKIYNLLLPFQMKWFVCPKSASILKGRRQITRAKSSNWDTEYLDYKMNCRVVPAIEEAILHIETHGSRHSECIVTAAEKTAELFQNEIDAAAVYWNASTRFTDGFELGLGGELGISTQKLHARGPVGLKELTSVRWVMTGTGQIRSG